MSEPVASPPRPGTKGDTTRQRIISAAMQCGAELGYARASIREIGRRSEVTSSNLYHYFPNKAELMRAAYEEMSAGALPRLEAAVDRAHGFVAKVVAVIDEGGQIMAEYPYAIAFDLAIRGPGGEEAGIAETNASIFASLHDLIVTIVAQARDDGELRTEVTNTSVTHAVFALMRGLYEHASQVPAAEFRATSQTTRLLLQGTLVTTGHT